MQKTPYGNPQFLQHKEFSTETDTETIQDKVNHTISKRVYKRLKEINNKNPQKEIRKTKSRVIRKSEIYILKEKWVERGKQQPPKLN